MKAIVGAAVLGLAFGAQDDELWSLFPKAAPISEPTLIIENNQNSGTNAVKINQATYTGRSYLFKKPDALTLDDDNELWSLFPKAEVQAVAESTPIIENNQNAGTNAVKMNENTYTGKSYLFKKPATLTLDDDDNELWSLFPKAAPVSEPTLIIENSQNSGTNAVKMNQNTYTGKSYLFKKPDALTLDDNDNELFVHSEAADSELAIRFLGNLNKFVGKVFQQPKKTIMAEHADDELVNLDFLINDALQVYNDAKQPKDKRDYGKIVNDVIALARHQKKRRDDEDNELNLLSGVFKKKGAAIRGFLGRDDEN